MSPIFDKRLFGTLTAFACVLIVMALAWQLTFVLLLTFAAILLAILLHRTALLLTLKTKLSIGKTMSVVIVLVLVLAGVFFYATGPKLVSEGALVVETLPKAWNEVKAALNDTRWGSYVLERMQFGDSDEQEVNLVGLLQGTVSTTLGLAVNLVVVISMAIYLAVNPDLYRVGFAKLFPKHRRKRVVEVLDELGDGLWSWMAGQALDMLLVGVLIWLGLWMLSVPMPFALGTIAGVTNFIPYVGPFLGAAPAVVVAFAREPSLAIWTAGWFVIVQQLDSHVFMPLIQKRVTALPPVLTILVVVAAGALFGLLGVLLATPFLLVMMILIRMLYIEDVLDDQTEQSDEPNTA